MTTAFIEEGDIRPFRPEAVSSSPDLNPDEMVKLATLAEGENVLSDGEASVNVTVRGRADFDNGGFMAVIFESHRYFYVKKGGVLSGLDGMTMKDVREFIGHFFDDVGVGAVSRQTAGAVEQTIH